MKIHIFLKLILFALAYYLGGLASHWLAFPPYSFTTLWIPCGIMLSVLLLSEKKYWPYYLLTGYFANVLVDLSTLQSLSVGLVFSLINVLQTYLGAALIKKFVGEKFTFHRVSHLFAFLILGAFLPTLITASIASAIITKAKLFESFNQVLSTWWVADVLAITIITPTIVSFPEIKYKGWHKQDKLKLAEYFLMLTCMIIVALNVFNLSNNIYGDYRFLIVPFLIWAALRFDLFGISLTMLIVSVLAIVEWKHTESKLLYGKFNLGMLLSLQVYLIITNLSALILSVINTYQRKVSKELGAERDLLQTLMDQAPDSIYFKDSESRFTRINKVQAAILGLNSTEDAIGKTDFDFFTPEHAIEAFQEEKLMMKTGKPLIGKMELIRDQRKGFCWVASSKAPIKNANGEIIGIVGIATDITAIKKIEEELRISEDKYKLLFKKSPVGILQCDENLIISACNEKFVQILGTTREKLINLDIKKLRDKRILPAIYKALEGEESFYEGYYNATTSNTKLWAIIKTTPLTDDNGKVAGAILIVEDGTKRKESEEELKKYTEEILTSRNLLEKRSTELSQLSQQLSQSEKELRELNASKDKFFSIVAHDLKSPFHGLLGYSRILIEEFDEMNRESIKGYIVNVNKHIKNLFKLIENLLDWSRMQTGRMEFKPEKLDLFENVVYGINLVVANAENKGIQIINHIKKDELVFADEQMLNSVIENFLSNAIKFTEKGGTITIDYNQRENFIEVSITDTGVGISEENLNKIFRIDESHSTLGTEQEKGTGLGLILCKEMIEQNGGEIKVESKIDEGTKFTFSIPIWLPENKQEAINE